MCCLPVLYTIFTGTAWLCGASLSWRVGVLCLSFTWPAWLLLRLLRQSFMQPALLLLCLLRSVDQRRLQIQLPLPARLDPSVSMMQVEEKPDITYR